MATLRESIFTRCTTEATLAALINTRCYPVLLPDGVDLPALSYRQISEDDSEYRTHGEATDRMVTRVSFDVWAETSDDAAELADALVAAWSGYQNMPDVGYGQIASRMDDFETGLNRFRTIVDVFIEHAR